MKGRIVLTVVFSSIIIMPALSMYIDSSLTKITGICYCLVYCFTCSGYSWSNHTLHLLRELTGTHVEKISQAFWREVIAKRLSSVVLQVAKQHAKAAAAAAAVNATGDDEVCGLGGLLDTAPCTQLA